MKGLDRLHDIADDLDRTAWGRELASALHETAAHIGEEVDRMRDLSGYESDVMAWVEAYGGLEEVKAHMIPEENTWPFYEDGEPVRIGEYWGEDDFDTSVTRIDTIEFAADGIRLGNEYTEAFYRPGERVKRPAPAVLDADGAEIRVGDTVYLLPGDWCDVFPCFGYHGGEELEIFSLHADHVEGGVGCRDTRRPKGTCYPQPSQLTHRAPVLAGDGKPLEVGQTVYLPDGMPVHVTAIGDMKAGQETVFGKAGNDTADSEWQAVLLTHERPDSWERLEEDAMLAVDKYRERYRLEKRDGMTWPKLVKEDLVRRAKALAERGA